MFLIFLELLKIPEINVFLPRLSLGTFYKWIHFNRKKCFDKMFFWPFVGNGFFWWPSQSKHSKSTVSQLYRLFRIKAFQKAKSQKHIFVTQWNYTNILSNRSIYLNVLISGLFRLDKK